MGNLNRLYQLIQQESTEKGDNKLMELADEISIEMKELSEKLYMFEYRDHLTGVKNRNSLMLEFEALKGLQKQYSAFKIKIVGLGKINSLFGIEVGDFVLKELANRFDSIENTELYRMDGTEFILVGFTKEEEILKNKIISIIQENVCYKNHKLLLGAYIGMVRYPESGETLHELQFNVDVAVEHSKLLGINRVGILTEEMQKKKSEENRIVEALPLAIEQGEMELYYQAQLCMDTKKPIGLEALLRWKKDGKFISPMVFIPLAEKNGIILDIGYFVFEEVCKYQKKLMDKGIDISVAVNVSVSQLADEDFVSNVEKIINKTKADRSKIDIEITESMEITKDELINEKINALKNMGFKIVMDDFGTGYSSLGYLKEGIFDKLKIDREFVKNIKTGKDNPVDELLLVSMINLAKGVGMVVVVEGVETFEQLKFLESTECNIIQGFYYSKPIPSDEMINYVLNMGWI